MHTAAPLSGMKAIILVHPKYPENIGASARIAHNFGIDKLIVVSDLEHDEEKMLKMATHKAAHLVREREIYATTVEATRPFHYLIATTARQGRQRPEEMTPREAIGKILPFMADTSIALMFGPESTGLANEDVDLCQFTSTIPTAGFSSLNLAQAVAIHCYELYTANPPAPHAEKSSQEYANSFDLEGMYSHIEDALKEITFLGESNTTYWMRSIRQFLGRMELKKKEASMIRGVCRKFLWHSRHERKL